MVEVSFGWPPKEGPIFFVAFNLQLISGSILHICWYILYTEHLLHVCLPWGRDPPLPLLSSFNSMYFLKVFCLAYLCGGATTSTISTLRGWYFPDLEICPAVWYCGVRCTCGRFIKMRHLLVFWGKMGVKSYAENRYQNHAQYYWCNVTLLPLTKQCLKCK